MDAKISADKKARVLTSAEMVFLRQGYSRTTMGDLAGAAGISRPALYLIYPRKHELFSSIIREEAKGGSPARETHSETDLLQHWMVWVCDLWLGERGHLLERLPQADRRVYQRSDAMPKEIAFLESLLEQGLAQRLPRSVGEDIRRSVAKLLTFCVCGLVDSDLDPEQRRTLLALQVDALAQAVRRHSEPEQSPPLKPTQTAKSSPATGRAA